MPQYSLNGLHRSVDVVRLTSSDHDHRKCWVRMILGGHVIAVVAAPNENSWDPSEPIGFAALSTSKCALVLESGRHWRMATTLF
eukprot:2052419-Pyramimonas_sp.AAC.1